MLLRTGLLHERSFVRWCSASLLASIGQYWQLIAIAGYLAVRSGALSSALVAAAAFGPGFLAAPLGGYLADRLHPRVILASSAFVHAMSSAALAAALLAEMSSGWLIGIITVQGFLGALIAPASSVVLHATLPDTLLERGLGVLNAVSEVGRLAGALFAGFMFISTPLVGVIASGAGQLILVLGTIGMRPPHDHRLGSTEAFDSTTKTRFLGGLRLALQNPFTRIALFASMWAHVLLVPYLGLTAAKAAAVEPSQWLPQSAVSLTGVMSALGGVGAAIGSVWFACYVKRERLAVAMLTSTSIAGLSFAWWGLSTTALMATVAVLFVAFGVQMALNVSTLVLHIHAPGSLRGQMFGIRRAIIDISYASGLAAFGFSIDRQGFSALAVGGVLAAMLGIGTTFWFIKTSKPSSRPAV